MYRWPGATYVGDVRDGRRHGRGKLSFDDSPAVYEGEWRDGARHGAGTLWFNEERTAYYEGAGTWCGPVLDMQPQAGGGVSWLL